MKRKIIAIVSLPATYLVAAFIGGSMDFMTWGVDGRMAAVLLAVVVWLGVWSYPAEGGE